MTTAIKANHPIDLQGILNDALGDLAGVVERLRRSLRRTDRPSLEEALRANPGVIHERPQEVYASLCNQEWRHRGTGKVWSCSWRYAGGLVADILGEGDYMDWYCSGLIALDTDPDPWVPEGTVTPEVLEAYAALGWEPVREEDSDE